MFRRKKSLHVRQMKRKHKKDEKSGEKAPAFRCFRYCTFKVKVLCYENGG